MPCCRSTRIDKGDIERVRVINENIMEQVLSAKKITDSLRVFSREDKTVEHEKCDINGIVDDVITLFHDEFNLSKVNLELTLTEKEVIAFVSPVQIGRVLSNLLLNARDAVDNMDQKNIKISTKLIDGDIILEVSDNGHGIRESRMNKIFEPFYTTKSVGKETGLGLSLSYSMIKDNGGEITVSSEEKEGTNFTIVFPVMNEVNDEYRYPIG